jgi:hypothetical protein
MQFCANSAAIQKSFEDVSKYDSLITLIQTLDVESVEQTDENYNERVDTVLTSLISHYDEEELSLKNQQAYYRFVVENQGDKQIAETQYEQLQQLQNENFNIGKQMIRWAMFDDETTTDIQVRKFGFQNTKNWFLQALDCWDIELQQAKPVNYSLNIDVWSGISNGEDRAEQAENMQSYYETNKFRYMFIDTMNIALLLLVVLSTGFAFAVPYSLVITAVSLGTLVYRCIKAFKEYPLRVNAALQTLDTCMAEITDFRAYYNDKRQLKDRLISQVEFI